MLSLETPSVMGGILNCEIVLIIRHLSTVLVMGGMLNCETVLMLEKIIAARMLPEKACLRG